jgi:hypothetical protein
MNPNIITSQKHLKFSCETCHFECSKKGDYNRHTLTNKHKILTNPNKITSNVSSNEYDCICGKTYKHMSSLCAHKKYCKGNNETIDSNAIPQTTAFETIDSNIVIKQLIQQNQDFKDLLIEQNKTIIEAMKHHSISNNTINQVNTNSNNKTFNLQVFLNEDCKDAMNISDFMSSIQLQLEELVSVGKLGFVEGISNIIIKNLKALDIHKRPLHCTDLKRETVYIKENGVWVKDDEANTKLRKVIKNVAFRNSKNTRLFKDKYPDCVRSESRLSDTYSIIIIEAMGGGSKTDPKESEDKILRRILKELTIDKSKYLS